MRPDRTIIGINNEALLTSLYDPFNHNYERIIIMDICSAEITKYTANVMLATKISFMNEMVDVNIEAVHKGIGAGSRISYSFRLLRFMFPQRGTSTGNASPNKIMA